MLTSGQFWAGVIVGGVLVMFVLPWARGMMANRGAAGA